ncbi:ATP-binding protein [Nonomuraea sp. KC401]|nr:AAA family ATPase [Nonomuraea sp. K271]TLF53949.1 ATP-binding protein [Nonomuraea sp. KC401]
MLPETCDDHYLALPQAKVVATPALQHTKAAIRKVVAKKAMMCVHGDSGTGKTFCVNESLRHLARDRSYRIEFRERPSPLYIREALFDALGIAGKRPQRPAPFDRLLKDVLAEEPRVFICDEAQWQPKECFEYWRHLWDDKHTDMAIIFVGGEGCYEVLSNEQMLASRIYIWQEFREMKLKQVLEVIPDFHPIWSDVSDEHITFVDDTAAHGNFRTWTKITNHVLDILEDDQATAINEELMRRVFSNLGGRPKKQRAA